MALSLDGTTGISASGNISGNNIIVTGSLTAGNFSPASVSTSGNVVGGNILTGGLISATGNITGSFILGNGSQLTGIDATSIQSGTSNVRVVSSGGNVATGIGETSNVVVVATTGQFIIGVNSVSGTVTGGNIATAGTVSATGNITGGNVSGTNLTGTLLTASQPNITAVGTLTSLNSGTISSSGNVTGANFLTGGIVSATGNILGGNLNVTGNIVDTGAISIITGSNGNIDLAPNGTGNVNITGNVMPTANATANIGSASLSFNTIFARATSAQYADLAEMYSADANYTPGTVLDFGGSEEVTATTTSHSVRIAGIVSTAPSYLMNSALDCANAVKVALVGRVPCHVVGTIAKGDRLVASSIAGVATRLDIAQYQPGCIVGKALEAYNSNSVGTIEVAVGRI